jgi:8-oxo-dGTP pyrophosphatase MutT (NUDIX family)
MPRIVEKVTAFITRPSADGRDLLLFEHPTAGIQIPAGTVEPGETPAAAILREAREESGLEGLSIRRYLGSRNETLPPGARVIYQPTKVSACPEEASSDWAYLQRGLQVSVNRREMGFTQVTYIENDREPDPGFISLQITGWVPDATLAAVRQRHFFLLDYAGESGDQWAVYTDRHIFKPFWAPLDDLPEIIPPQDSWLDLLVEA